MGRRCCGTGQMRRQGRNALVGGAVVPGIDPATLSPTGHWIGGVGITLNTTPDPDQVSAWADQSGNGRDITAPNAAYQPRDHVYVAGNRAPYFRNARPDALTSVAFPNGQLLHFLTASAFTYLLCWRPEQQLAFSADKNIMGRPMGDSLGRTGIFAYDHASGTQVALEARGHVGAVMTYWGPVYVPVGAVSVVWMRRASGTTQLGANHGIGPTTASLVTADLTDLTGTLRIGNVHVTHRGTEGPIYHAATWNTALTDDQIAGVTENLLHRYASAT